MSLHLRTREAANYVVYLLIDPRDLMPFYVGMTCRPGTRWAAHYRPRGSPASPRLGELRSLGLKCRVRLMRINMMYKEARALERQTIAEHSATILNSGHLTPRRRYHRPKLRLVKSA